MPKIPREYRGGLSAEEIVEGANRAIDNSRRLLSDAEMLYSGGRIASALALAILAIEEAGKVSILRRLSTAKSENQIKEAWRHYCDHRSKNSMWILPALFASGKKTICDVAVATQRNCPHTLELNLIKQLSIYTDCLGEKYWSSPEEFIDDNPNIVDEVMGAARTLCKAKYITLHEIILWQKHMTIDIDNSTEGFFRGFMAFLSFADEAYREGLSPIPIETYGKFFGVEE